MDFTNFAIKATQHISIILFYMILVSMVGYLRALITKWMGDDTAEQQGFLTLNPAVHADLFGFLFLLYLHIGWGRRIPINTSNIHGRFRWLKITIAVLSGVFAYLLFAVLGLIAVAYIMGPSSSLGMLDSFAQNSLPVLSIIKAFISMCIFLAAMELVINIVLLGMLFILEYNDDAWQYASYIILIIPIIIFIMYGNQIQFLLANGITALAKIVATLLFRS